MSTARQLNTRAPTDAGGLVRRGVDKLDDKIGPKARIDFALAGRQLEVCQSILAMPKLGGDQLLKEWMLGSRRDRNLATVGKRDHPQSVVQALCCGYVSRDHGDGANIELGRM